MSCVKPKAITIITLKKVFFPCFHRRHKYPLSPLLVSTVLEVVAGAMRYEKEMEVMQIKIKELKVSVSVGGIFL